MTGFEAEALVSRMHLYEGHDHLDGYDVTRAEYETALSRYPVTMQLALIRYERDWREINKEWGPTRSEV